MALAAVFGMALGICPSSDAQTFEVLYSFAGYPTDGGSPSEACSWTPPVDVFGLCSTLPTRCIQ